MLDRIKQEYKSARMEIYKCIITKMHFYKGHTLSELSFFKALEKILEKHNDLDLFEELCFYSHETFRAREVNIIKYPSKLLTSLSVLHFKSLYNLVIKDEKQLVSDCLFIKDLIEFLEGKVRMFYDFDGLREFLDNADFSLKEKADIVVQIVTKNSDIILSEDFNTSCDDDLKAKEVRDVFLSVADFVLDNKDAGKESSSLNSPAGDLIDDLLSKYQIDIEKFQKYCANVINCHNIANFVRGNSISDADFFNSLSKLGFEDISGILIGRRKKKEEKKSKQAFREENITAKKVVSSKKPTRQLSKKEQNKILNEIKRVYDFDNDMCLTTLSMNKIIEYTSKLMLINADKKTIERFLLSFEKRLRQNPINGYRELMGKMRYLITDELTLSYVEEIEATLDKLVYEVDLKKELESISEYLKVVNSIIDSNFTYEYSRAEELLGSVDDGKSPKIL